MQVFPLTALQKRRATVLLLLSAVCCKSLFANAQLFAGSPSAVYYDADELNPDSDTGNIRAKGHAFILLGNVFVSADSFEYNKTNKTIIAEGGVRVVRNRERITASRVMINEQTNEARMDDVEIYADPKDTEAQINEEVLGFSSAELAFEVARQERAKEIIRELNETRTEYANLQISVHPQNKSDSNKLILRYTQLLERLLRTRYQPSDVLRNLPEDARRRLENRREAVRTFATKDPELAKKIAGLQRVPGYLSLKAQRIFQNSNQNMDVEKASLTTCRCGPEDNPAWGLSAARAYVEPNEYITLYGSTLEVARFPLVYSPWFKMPIKTKRQSGFLLPSFYFSRGGDAAQLPYYLILGDHADSTLGFTYFSKRGPRAEVELRTALSEDSKTTVRGELLRQKGNLKENTLTAPVHRWTWNAQSNVPLLESTSLKFDVEKISDQRYFSDLTKEPGATQDLFAPQTTVKRFIQQDASLEHVGQHFFLGLSVRHPDDVFAEPRQAIPARLPRVDLSLFPYSIGDSGFYAEGQSSFERIRQKSAMDSAGTETAIDGTHSDAKIRLNYALPQNPIANVSVGQEIGYARYKTSAHRGEANYGQLDLKADVPLYTNFFSSRSGENIETHLRHNLTPFATMRWVPHVRRSADYPSIYSTFYTADNYARAKVLEFGLRTDLQILREEFKPIEKGDVQINPSGARISPPANEQTIFTLLKMPRPTTEQDTALALYSVTGQAKNQQIFLQWALSELQQYVSEIRSNESRISKSLISARPHAWRRETVFNTRPVSFSLRTSYNFDAEQTAQDLNQNLRADQPKVSSAPWGEVTGQLGLSTEPILPVSGTILRVWQPQWRTFKEQSSSIDLTSPFGFNANFIRSTVRSEALDANGQRVYPEEELWGVDTSYQPLSWLKLQVQYRKTLKPQPAVSRELEYSSLQKITFLGIQDCVDITLQRFKDRDVIERLATWTLGLNLSFLGQQRQIESLGKIVDRTIKSQLNKGR
jgi:hypothetical protein